jgi:hypothetical protein
MRHTTISTLTMAALALTTLTATQAAAASPDAPFGPPWISVEYPANPHHPSTRGATFLVHTYHHSTSIAVPMTAVAEGLVDGRRTSVPLDIKPTDRAGVYAVRAAVPEQGTWLVAVTLEEGEGATATALVSLGRDGTVMTARVPSTTSRDGWVVPRGVTAADIEAELQAARRFAGVPQEVRHAGLAAGLLFLAFAGLATRRRN